MIVMGNEERYTAPLGRNCLPRVLTKSVSSPWKSWYVKCTGFTSLKQSGAAMDGALDAANRVVSRFTIAGTGPMAALTESRTWSHSAGIATS
jgi:hypothetical protein